MLKPKKCLYCGKKVSTPCETEKNASKCANNKQWFQILGGLFIAALILYTLFFS